MVPWQLKFCDWRDIYETQQVYFVGWLGKKGSRKYRKQVLKQEMRKRKKKIFELKSRATGLSVDKSEIQRDGTNLRIKQAQLVYVRALATKPAEPLRV